MPKDIKQDFVTKYRDIGAVKFYRYLLSSAILKLSIQIENKAKIIKYPDSELMDIYDKFMTQYRREGEEDLLQIALLCRRAGHKIYRELRKQNLVEFSNRFLNLVK